MKLQLMAASFEDSSLGMRGTRTDDGQVLSVLFDRLHVESLALDTDAAPQVRRVEGVVQCEGLGWVSVQLRGAAMVAGRHGFAHVMAWANGRRLRAGSSSNDDAAEPFSAGTAAPVGNDGRLRLSLLLLAQRDLAAANTEAACWVDSIDLTVLHETAARARRTA